MSSCFCTGLPMKKQIFHISLSIIVCMIYFGWYSEAIGEDYSVEQGTLALKNTFTSKTSILSGTLQHHIVRKKETLLDIARNYDLGFNEIQDLYPDLDPWLPPEGTELIIPSQRILPVNKGDGIVINIAELRLYYFTKNIKEVLSFPVGLG